MKKNLLFLCMVLVTLSFFNSCSDDDKNDTDWQNTTGTYDNNSLKLSLNGTDVPADASVAFKAISENEGELTLTNVLPYADTQNLTVKVTLAKLTKAVTTEDYAFEGTNESIPGLKVTVQGSISNEILTLAITTSGTTTLLGAYSSTTANKLVLTYSEKELIGKTVSLDQKDGKYILTLQNIVPGETQTSIELASLTETNDAYPFEGTLTTAEGNKLTYKGNVKSGTLTIDLKVVLPTNDIMGTWPLAASYSKRIGTSRPPKIDKSSALVFEWESSADAISPFFSVVKIMLPDMCAALLNGVLKDITFKEDGNIIASYAPMTPEVLEKCMSKQASEIITRSESDWVSSPLNLAFYYIKDGKLFIIPNMDMITRQIELDKTKSDKGNFDLSQILPLLQVLIPNGVPFTIQSNYPDNGKDQTSLIIDKDLTTQLLSRLISYIPQLIPTMLDKRLLDLIPADSGILVGEVTLQQWMETQEQLKNMTLKDILNEMDTNIKELTKLNIGLTFNSKNN